MFDIAALLEADPATASDEVVTAVIAQLISARAQLDAALAARVAVLDARNGAQREGCPSTRAWLQARHRLSSAEASRLLGLARAVGSCPGSAVPTALDTDAAATPGTLGCSGLRPALTPVAAAALAAGQVNPEHVRVIATARASAASTTAGAREIEPEVLTAGETLLVEQARVLDPNRLRVVAEAWLNAVAPEAAAGDAAATYARRALYASPSLEGMVEITGRLDPHNGQALLAVLEPLTRPLPEDERTAAQRRADALGEACRRLLDTASLPEVAAERPHLVLTVDTTTLQRTLAQHCPATAGPPALLDPAALPAPAHYQRTGSPDWPDLLALTCDAVISRVVLGPARRPLDIGWRSRQWTPWQRRAIAARDRGCTWPGCPRPAAWCEIDHILRWQDGGPTDMGNGRLLCSYHHHLRHDGWQLTGTPGGTWTAIPPPDWGVRSLKRRRRRRVSQISPW